MTDVDTAAIRRAFSKGTTNHFTIDALCDEVDRLRAKVERVNNLHLSALREQVRTGEKYHIPLVLLSEALGPGPT